MRTGLEKALIFLKALGEDTAARILDYLPDEKVSKLKESMESIPTPTAEEVGLVYREMSRFALEAPVEPLKIEGKVDEEYRSESVVDQMNRLKPQELLLIFQDEQVQMISFVLNHINPDLAEQYLQLLSPGRRQEIEKSVVENFPHQINLFQILAEKMIQKRATA